MRRPFEISLDPMMNIAVCLVGTLIFIIIATGAGNASTNIVIPTPIEHHTSRRAIFIECRNDQLYLVPVDELSAMASLAVAKARLEFPGNTDQLIASLAATHVANETYEVDLRHHLAVNGRTLAVSLIPGARGYPLGDYSRERTDGWYATLLARMNHASESLYFLVRDDSFRVFKNARLLAWQTGAEVSFELLSADDIVNFPTTHRK